MSTMSSSIVIGNTPTRDHVKSYLQRPQDTKLGFSNFKNIEIRLVGNKSRLHFGSKTKRNPLTVCADSIPGGPLPSTPPPTGSILVFILGIAVALILPLLSRKWDLGSLLVIQNRIENTVQKVEDVVEVVEKVATQVDKIAEEISDDLPQGRLKDLVDSVEDMAEKTAKTADALDNLIDKVQEAEDEVESIVESIDKEAKRSSKQTKEEK